MTASLIVAIVGLVFSCLSLGWQAANFVLTGGRVKVTLRVGAAGPSGLLHGDPGVATDGYWERLAALGFVSPVVVVNVANVGRQPVTVVRWSLTGPVVSFCPVTHLSGPKLPHRLEVGQSELWAVDLTYAADLMQTSRAVLRKRKVPTALLAQARHRRQLNQGVRAVVELATGKVKMSRAEIQ